MPRRQFLVLFAKGQTKRFRLFRSLHSGGYSHMEWLRRQEKASGRFRRGTRSPSRDGMTTQNDQRKYSHGELHRSMN